MAHELFRVKPTVDERCRLFERSEGVVLIDVSGEFNDCQYNAVIEALRHVGHECGMNSVGLRGAVCCILRTDFERPLVESIYRQLFDDTIVMDAQTGVDDFDYEGFRERYLYGVGGSAEGDSLTLQVIADVLLTNVNVHVANFVNVGVWRSRVVSRRLGEMGSSGQMREIDLFLLDRHYRFLERRSSDLPRLAPSFADIVAVS